MKAEEITQEYSEKLVPLTQEEIEALKKRRWKAVAGILAFSVVWYGVLIFFGLGSSEGFFTVFLTIFALAPLAILAMVLWNAKRDIDFAQKKVIRGRIDNKYEKTRTSGSAGNSSSTTYYYFTVGGKEIAVGYSHYNEFQSGDIIEIDMMPKSSDIVKIRELRSNLLKNGERKKPVFASDFEKKNREFFKEARLADTAPLTPEEENLLKTLRNKRAFRTLLWCGVLGFIGYYILFFSIAVGLIFLDRSDPSLLKVFGGFSGQAVHYGVIAFIVGLSAFILYRRAGMLQRDLANGRKEIFKAVIGDKVRSNVKILGKYGRQTSSRGDFHYVVIDGRHHAVSPEQFEQLDCGDYVKLHIAPHSGKLLKIEGV